MGNPFLTTKDKILETAANLLEESGIKAVTQPAVAKLVGISQGQLTYHFPKRSDLVLALTDLALDRVAEFIWKKYAKSPKETVEKLTPLVWELIRNHSRVRALLGLVAEADDNPEVRERLMRQETRARSLIAAGLGLNDDSELTTLVHATMLGFGVLSFLRAEKQEELERDFAAAIRLFREKFATSEKPRRKTLKTRKGSKKK